MRSTSGKYLLVFAALCLFSLPAAAQLTTVSGTVKDVNGIPYVGGAMKAGLVFAGTPVSNPTLQISNLAQCKANGFGSAPCQVPFNPNAGPFTLDPFGNIAGGGITLQDNSLVTPAGTQWAFFVSETPGIPPPLGTGPQVCSATITITGASQSISSSFSACPALSNVSSSGTAAGTFGQTQVNNNGPFGATNCLTFTDLTVGPINFNCPGIVTQAQSPASGDPYWDVKAFGASGSNQNTTGSINSGSKLLTLAAAKDFKNGQGINVFSGGPTSAMLPPTGCTVTPIGVPGATTYNYQVSSRDSLGGLSAATSVITTSTGNAALGQQLLTIAASGYVRTAGAVTITLTTSPSIPTGTTVDVYGTGDLSSNGRFTTSGGTANTITFTQAFGASREPDVTLSGGTVRVQNYNQVTCTGASTNATQYIVWGRTGGSLTKVGSMPVETVTGQNPTFRDFGHNSTVPADVLSTNPPVAATPQDLVSTIQSGAGTVNLVLVDAAGNTVAGNTVQHDDTAAINATLNAAASNTRTTFGGGGIVNLPLGSYNFGQLVFPATSPNISKWMVVQFSGELFPLQTIAWDTGQGPYKFVGLVGTGNAVFGKVPEAAINNTGINPQIQITGQSGNPAVVQSILCLTSAGDCVHVYGSGVLAPSNVNLIDFQGSPSGSANYGSALRTSGGGFGTYITGGVFLSSDDAPGIYTDRGFTTIMGSTNGKMQVSSIECVNCGGDMIVMNILQENGNRPFLNINSSVLKTVDITVDHVSLADTAVPGAVPMVNNMNGGQGTYNLKITGYNSNGSDAIIGGVPVANAFLQPGTATSSGNGLTPIGQYVNVILQDISGSLFVGANGSANPPLVIQQSAGLNADTFAVRNVAGTRIAGIGKFGEGIFQADNTNSTFGIKVTATTGQTTQTDRFSNWFVRVENCPASFPLGISQACGSGASNTFELGSAAGYTGNYFSAYAINSIVTKVFNLGNTGIASARSHYADLGTACTNGELALSAGWQSTGAATVTAVAGIGQTCSWTLTTGTTTAANPTVTDTLVDALPNAGIVCEINIHGGTHTAVAGEYFQQTTLSATAPIFTFQGTPTAGGTTYFVTRRCGP